MKYLKFLFLIPVIIAVWFLLNIFNSNNPQNMIAPLKKPIMDIGYDELDAKFKADDFLNSTNLQQQEFMKQFIGKRIRWSGYVEEVEGDGTILIDMQDSSQFGLPDIECVLTKEQAMKFNLNDEVIFEGDIQDLVPTLWGGTIDLILIDVEIEKVTSQ